MTGRDRGRWRAAWRAARGCGGRRAAHGGGGSGLRRRGALRQCHIKASKYDPAIGGRATVVLTIAVDGKVTRVDVTAVGIGLEERVMPCVTPVLRRSRFAAMEEDTQVRLVLVFDEEP